MPTDKQGNRAEIIMDPDSRQKRMNLGGVFEPGINAASRDVTRQLRSMAGIDPFLERNVHDLTERELICESSLQQVPESNFRKMWDYYLDYVVTCSQPMYDLITQKYDRPPQMLMKSVLAEGIRLWRPTDNPTDTLTCVKEIREKFMPVYDKVVYGENGDETDVPVLIGSTYILLLEKTGAEFSAASSAKLQHFGIPSKISNADRFSAPGRNNPVRILGESEIRLMIAVVGSDVVADLIDMSNNPQTHKEIIRQIHESDKPTSFTRILDRGVFPLGNSRPLLFVRHILQCAGIQFKREIHDPERVKQIEHAVEEYMHYKELDNR